MARRDGDADPAQVETKSLLLFASPDHVHAKPASLGSDDELITIGDNSYINHGNGWQNTSNISAKSVVGSWLMPALAIFVVWDPPPGLTYTYKILGQAMIAGSETHIYEVTMRVSGDNLVSRFWITDDNGLVLRTETENLSTHWTLSAVFDYNMTVKIEPPL